MSSQPVFQLYAELDNYKPKIWRRFQIANNITVARLGYILMTLFEMRASHLFCFNVPIYENFKRHTCKECTDKKFNELFDEAFTERYFPHKNAEFHILDEELRPRENIYDATQYKIKNVLENTGDSMVFWYDFGDDWYVSIALEQIIADKELPGSELPRVLDGAGYGIIEDCCGTEGLKKIATAFKKKKGTLYNQYREWLELDDLDIDNFDIEDMNFRLKKIPRIYSQIYEKQLMPTRKSIDLIERRYPR